MSFNFRLTPEEREIKRARLARLPRLRDPAEVIPPGGNFYDTGIWQYLRGKTIMKYGNRCQRCGFTGSSENPIQVDHIKPRSKYPELERSLGNLQVLCRDCNMAKGNTDETDWRTW